MDTNTAPVGGDAPAVAPSIAVHTPAGDGPLTAREAARSLVDWRRKSATGETKSAEPEGAETPPQEQPKEVNDAAPPSEAPGETTTETPDPQAAQPEPIEAPRSWTKEEKERFKSLPRETQEYLAQREQDRDRELRRSQNEAAERQKGLSAKEQEIEAARQKYESALPALLETLQNERAGEFGDIKSVADLEKLSREDPFRYLQWTARQQKIAAVENELRAAQERQSQEQLKRWGDFASREDELVLEKIPELADETKAPALREKAKSILKDLGFSEGELGNLYNGKSALSLRDNRIQQLVFKAIKYDEAQKAKSAAEKKPVPPVQRPGSAPARGAAQAERLKGLETKLSQSGSIKDAAALLAARRAARSR